MSILNQVMQGMAMQEVATAVGPDMADPVVAMLSRHLGRRPGGGAARPAMQAGTVPNPDQQQLYDYAKQRAREMFGRGHWNELKELWSRESGWNPDAANPTSSARGIPQAMMSVHFDPDNDDNWREHKQARRFLNNPYKQIEWGLDYIANRDAYGDPTKALNFWDVHGYY
jgi:hypothetical protein